MKSYNTTGPQNSQQPNTVTLRITKKMNRENIREKREASYIKIQGIQQSLEETKQLLDAKIQERETLLVQGSENPELRSSLLTDLKMVDSEIISLEKMVVTLHKSLKETREGIHNMNCMIHSCQGFEIPEETVEITLHLPDGCMVDITCNNPAVIS